MTSFFLLRFFPHFPDLCQQSIDAMLDLCEDVNTMIRMQVPFFLFRCFSLESFPPHNLYLTLLECQLLTGRFLKLSSPLLGSTSSTLHHHPRIMSGQIHVTRVYPKVDRENKQGGLFRSRIGTCCFLFKLKECALDLAWHLSYY